MSPYLRLAAYRALALDWEGQRITSEQIGQELGVNPTQVRRDISTMLPSGIGRRGAGYDCRLLAEAVRWRLVRRWDRVLREAEQTSHTMSRVLAEGGS